MAVAEHGGALLLPVPASTDITNHCLWGELFWHHLSSHLGSSQTDSMLLVNITVVIHKTHYPVWHCILAQNTVFVKALKSIKGPKLL